VTAVRFDHVSIALDRIADAPAVLVGVLGGAPRVGGPNRDFNFGAWRFQGGGLVEILEPRGEDGFLQRFLARHGPGIHHVTFRVPALRAACDRAEACGYRVVGYDDSNPAWATAYLHPKEALGIVVQLAESSVPGQRRPWVPPPGPPDPPPPVTIVGLRMRARAPERARIQWGSVLGGEVETGPDGALVCRWPGSPMRIAVTIDPAGPEGPVAIEFAAERVVRLPGGPLGAAFLQIAPAAPREAPR
jgi:methylmalonyl-CoA/ethylmalonyl-CoA epimerase